MTRDEIERVARAWASMDGKAESFDACKADPALEDTEGRYGGYMADAEELLQRSGLMARLEDAEAAQALIVERAAEVARRHHSKVQINEPLWHDGQDWASDRIAEAIEALADPSGVEALAALRAEIADLKLNMDADLRTMIREGAALKAAEAERDDALTRLAAAEAQVGARVKPLVFSEFRDGGCVGRPHSFQYFITQDHSGQFWCHHDSSKHDSLSKAQEHAQAHYQIAALASADGGAK